MKNRAGIFFFSLALAGLLFFPAHTVQTGSFAEKRQQVSDHFDGNLYFNPGVPQTLPSPSGQDVKSGRSRWIWGWIFGYEWPPWPATRMITTGPAPPSLVPKGVIHVTPVGHATFLIQIDGLNILTDPIWSERCSPLSWAGPKRYRSPGLRFEDLPAIDVVLVSHNHYDHLDIPTLERLARKGVQRAIAPLGNGELITESGIPTVDMLDWWQNVQLSPDVTVTLVPAQHFSARTLWDRNKSLWGGFVISGPSGNVFFAGDTGYGPHFGEIARRFSPVRVALLPIAPFRPKKADEPPPVHRSIVHMGPAEAVKAHMDLGAQVSLAAHFQVFRLGPDGFDDAVNELAGALKVHNLNPRAFVAPLPGQALQVSGFADRASIPRLMSRAMGE